MEMDLNLSQAQCPVVTPTCDSHRHEDADIYCYTCQQLICFDCIKMDSKHAKHKFEKLDKIVKALQQEVPSIVEEEKDKELSRLRAEVNVAKEIERRNSSVLENTIVRINKQKERLYSAIDEAAGNLIAAAKEKSEEKQRIIKNLITERTNRIQELEGAFGSLKDSLSMTNSYRLLKVKLDYDQKLDQQIGKLRKSDIPEIDTFYGEGEIIQDELRSMIGAVSIIKNKPSEVEVRERDEFTHGQNLVTYVVPVSIDNCWYLPSNGKEAKLTDRNGSVKNVRTFSKPCRGFDVTDDGEIFFSSYEAQCIQRLDIKNDSECLIMNTHPLRPIGIKLTPCGDLLVTALDDVTFDLKENSRRLVQRISKSGEVKRTYERDPAGKRLFTVPYKAKENYNGNICVIDQTGINTGRLCVLDLDGKVRFVYKGQSLKNTFLPGDLCCDVTCNIIVNDVNNYVIHLLNPAGQFVKYLFAGSPRATISFGMFNYSLWIGCNEGQMKVYEYHY